MNKEELFDFLSEIFSRFHYPITKEIFFTSGMFISFCLGKLSWITYCIIAGSSVLCSGPCIPMPPCDHEEADTRLCIHIQDSLENGARMIYVHTADTDVIVIIAGVFFELQATYPGLNIWVAFGMGKRFQYYQSTQYAAALVNPSVKHFHSIMHLLGVILRHSSLARERSQPGMLGKLFQVSQKLFNGL